jgi:pyruvate kinase
LYWGIQPLVVTGIPTTFEGLMDQAETILRARDLVSAGDKILVIGGVPPGVPCGSNFMKLHRIS